jgi:hypothetical protein
MIAETIPLLIALFMMGTLMIMIVILIMYHTYLACINLTTCKNNKYIKINVKIKKIYLGEDNSWDKITYLKKLPRSKGSPFEYSKT